MGAVLEGNEERNGIVMIITVMLFRMFICKNVYTKHWEGSDVFLTY